MSKFNITIRKSVRKYLSDMIPHLLNDAYLWISKKYPDVNFYNVDFVFSNKYNRSRYFRNSNNLKYNKPVVCISTKPILALYEKKSLGIKKRIVFVGSDVQISPCLFLN